MKHLFCLRRASLALLMASGLLAQDAAAAPKVVLISLDGMSPRFVNQYLQDGTLKPDAGIGRVLKQGFSAKQNLTVTPSLTAVGHVAIATGSTAANNDVMSNTFHLVASPFSNTVSGFSAPIGGYLIDGPAESPLSTAEPIWLSLRKAGKKVVTATFPGGDGLDVKVPGLSAVVQPAAKRTVDYTIPYGAASAPFQKGFSLAADKFAAAPTQTVAQLAAAGRSSYSPVLQANLETFSSGGVNYDIKLAALDTSNDGAANYDTLVFFDQTVGIGPGPFPLPLTGPAYVKPATKISALFYLEGHSQRAGVRYLVSKLDPGLASVHIARSSVSFISRTAVSASVPQVLANIDDINNHVGFWQPAPDFRIIERLDATPSTFADFSDRELEDIYEDLVKSWVPYQTAVAVRAIQQNPDADLFMTYIEQPDGSFHQFLLTDPRQPTDPTNPASVGAGQDAAKIARYEAYRKTAYQQADQAVERIIEATGGVDANGRPKADIIIVSDHGFAAFHTAVNMGALVNSIVTATTDPDNAPAKFPPSVVKAVTSGPAANIYFNLAGREAGGTVSRTQFVALQNAVVAGLKAYADSNPAYTQGAASVAVFDKVYARPLPANLNDVTFGRATSDIIGQDGGDVLALLALGYNFDGQQTPPVTRGGDSSNAILSVPNFYGAHGYDPALAEMSAVFYAAGPDFRVDQLDVVHNIDIAPTISSLLGVKAPSTVNGVALATKKIPPVECFLNWAESAYSKLFSPPGAATLQSSPYTYRYYSATNAYVGVSSADNHVYYLASNGVLQDVGDFTGWQAASGCK